MTLQERKPLQRNLIRQNYCESQSRCPCDVIKKSTGFCCMSVTASLLHLGAFLRDNLQMGAFFLA